MRRPTLVFGTLALALATIGLFAWAFQPARSLSTTSSPAASEATARRFYDAANHVIATGDVNALRAVVSPGFVETEPLPGTTPDRSGLESALRDLHATMPGIRLEIEELVAHGPDVMARIAIHGNPGTLVLGIAAAGPEPWGRVDRLVVAGGQVAERRTSVQGTGRLSVLSSVSLPLAAPGRVVVTLERVTIAPRVGFDVVTAEHPHMLIAESAGSQIELRSGGGSARSSNTDKQNPGSVGTLYPDALYVVPPGALYTVRNISPEVTSVLRLSMERPAPGGPAMGRVDRDFDGVTFRPVAGGHATILAGATLQVGLGRIALAPGAALSLSSFDGVALMELADGGLNVFADGEAYLRRGGDGSGGVVLRSGLHAGDGLLVGAGTSVVLRNEGTVPVSAHLVSVTTEAA